MLGFLSVSTLSRSIMKSSSSCFNPVLGFLSVSTTSRYSVATSKISFNPVLGFLSVSTDGFGYKLFDFVVFQSRAGFSECLDLKAC